MSYARLISSDVSKIFRSGSYFFRVRITNTKVCSFFQELEDRIALNLKQYGRQFADSSVVDGVVIRVVCIKHVM
ncbi:hypothetical protein PIROE2DRAFT_10697 [Piromyces sp. E2]|nr:hypothetical protein PIROE2DRAFT_10697 [Piromyces sp. E2]|eukprot:OUM62895.1 hypothetical protein PIROE2DRAFT_10697 [Piromyces sp. E2]